MKKDDCSTCSPSQTGRNLYDSEQRPQILSLRFQNVKVFSGNMTDYSGNC